MKRSEIAEFIESMEEIGDNWICGGVSEGNMIE